MGSGGASLPAYASLLLHDILEAIACCGSQKTGLGAADEAGQAGGARVGWRADRVRLTLCMSRLERGEGEVGRGCIFAAVRGEL